MKELNSILCSLRECAKMHFKNLGKTPHCLEQNEREDSNTVNQERHELHLQSSSCSLLLSNVCFLMTTKERGLFNWEEWLCFSFNVLLWDYLLFFQEKLYSEPVSIETQEKHINGTYFLTEIEENQVLVSTAVSYLRHTVLDELMIFMDSVTLIY